VVNTKLAEDAAAGDEKSARMLTVNSQIRNARLGLYGAAFQNFLVKRKQVRKSKQKKKKPLRGIEEKLGRRIPAFFPRFAKSNKPWQSFNIQGGDLKVRYESDENGRVWGYLTIPGVRARNVPSVGELRFRRHRKPRGEACDATVSHQNGRWYVSIVHEFDVKPPRHRLAGSAVGIDRNSTDLCGLSTSPTADFSDSAEAAVVVPAVRDLPNVQRLEAHRKKLQRRLSRMQGSKKGESRSNNYKRVLRQKQNVEQRLASIRDDYLKKTSQQIAASSELLVLEDLSISAMTRSAKGTKENPGRNVAQKRGMNREFLRNAPAEFAEKLQKKSAEYGGRVRFVQPAYTSQDCPSCGHRDSQNRSGTKFACAKCSSSDGESGVMRVETQTSVNTVPLGMAR